MQPPSTLLPTSSQPPPLPSILVIDDSESVRLQVSDALTASNFHVILAPHGAAGLDALASHPHISLIFCDIHMPVMGGLDFLEHLASSPHKHIPTLMLTAERAPQMILQARKLGAKGWLKKPFDLDLIISTARKLTAPQAL